jgi:hypothetical protein
MRQQLSILSMENELCTLYICTFQQANEQHDRFDATCRSSNASFNEFRVRLPCVSSRSLNEMPFDNAVSHSTPSCRISLKRLTGYKRRACERMESLVNIHHCILPFILIQYAKTTPIVFSQKKFSS